MKDFNGQELKVGQKVKCIEPIDGFLIKNKVYTVLGLIPESGRIIINPDELQREGHYKSTRFIISEEHILE